MTKLFAATALAGLLAAAPAFAQDATPAPMNPPAATGDVMTPASPTIDRFVAAPAADDWVATRLIGSTIYGINDENLGDVNDVLASKDGQVKAIVIGVGGFLGIGEKNVAVAPTALERVADGSNWKYRLNTTKDELTAAPEFKFPETPTDAAATGSVKTPADPATPMAPAAPSATTP